MRMGLILAGLLAVETMAIAGPPAVKVKWTIKYPATATESAKTDRGSKSIPVEGTAECLSNFKVESLLYQGEAETNREAARAASANLEVRLMKKARGKMAVPAIVITDGRSRHQFTFDVDVHRWESAGYQYGGQFPGEKLALPANWQSLEVVCAVP